MALPAQAGAPILASDMNDASYPGTIVAESIRASSSASFTTTETLLQSTTFAVTAGYRYLVYAVQTVEQSATGNVRVNTRWANGGTVANTDTKLFEQNVYLVTANKGVPATLIASFTATVTGNVTVGAFAVRDVGTGTCLSFGAASQNNTILVTRA